jgi:putative endonuclease
MKKYYVYIISNKCRGTLYVGVTNNLQRRLMEHKNGVVEGFSKKYNLKELVHVECYENVFNALKREKQLKKWNRNWKIELIEKRNPKWDDLSLRFFCFL